MIEKVFAGALVPGCALAVALFCWLLGMPSVQICRWCARKCYDFGEVHG